MKPVDLVRNDTVHILLDQSLDAHKTMDQDIKEAILSGDLDRALAIWALLNGTQNDI